jgi:hypothetical protein
MQLEEFHFDPSDFAAQEDWQDRHSLSTPNKSERNSVARAQRVQRVLEQGKEELTRTFDLLRSCQINLTDYLKK